MYLIGPVYKNRQFIEENFNNFRPLKAVDRAAGGKVLPGFLVRAGNVAIACWRYRPSAINRLLTQAAASPLLNARSINSNTIRTCQSSFVRRRGLSYVGPGGRANI
jgi:hypothetical protein